MVFKSVKCVLKSIIIILKTYEIDQNPFRLLCLKQILESGQQDGLMESLWCHQLYLRQHSGSAAKELCDSVHVPLPL